VVGEGEADMAQHPEGRVLVYYRLIERFNKWLGG
jgi:hypothetical protein